MNFIPPNQPTPAQIALGNFETDLRNLPEKEQKDIKYVLDRMEFLHVKFPQAAELAVVYISLRLAVAKGR
jgi:hypothetical protein